MSALAIAVAGLLLAAGAQSANAELYTENPCSPGYAVGGIVHDINYDDPWSAWEDCSRGYLLGNFSEAASEGSQGEFSLETTRGEMQSFSAHVFRPDPEGDGLKVGIRACRLTTCGPLVTSTPGPDSLLELSLDNDQIPSGALTLSIYIECENASCPAGSYVVLSGLQITRRDDTPPIFTFYESDAEFNPLPEASKWNNGALRFYYEGGDPESQDLYLKTEIEDLELCFKTFDVDMPVFGCTMYQYDDDPFFYASQLEDGFHEFSLSITNRASMTTKHTVMVKTDATPPRQPYQFDVTPRFNGWQNSRDVRIDWNNSPGETVETSTQSGIEGFTYDVDPVLGGSNPPTSSEDPPKKTVYESAADSLQLRLPGAGQWTVEIQTFDRAGNISIAGTASVSIDDAKLAVPAVDPIDPINAADRETGRTIQWVPPTPSVSGICGYDWAFAPIAGFNPGEDPNTPLLGGAPSELYLTPSQVQSLSERPQRFHLRGYSCAGVPGEIAHDPVIVDFTEPSVTISPSGGSLSAGELVSVGAQDVKAGTTQSGIASVSCTVNTAAVPCSNGAQIALGGGQNHLVVTAADAAGNSTTAEADIVADSGPPTGWIDQSDPADPTMVRATVQDSDTGVKSAEIEYKSASGGSWTKLGNGFKTESPSPGQVALSARIPDEGELANGDYLLRVRAIDSTGASGFITRRPGGDSAGFAIPLRATAVLTAGLTKSLKSKSAPLATLSVAYGKMPFLVGSLKRPDGTPIAGAELSIVADQPGSPTHSIGTVTTAADGSYSRLVPVGGLRRIFVRFAGNLAARSTAAEAQLRVRGKVTLKASRSTVGGKKILHLRGRVFTDGAVLPLLGKAVELRFTISGRRSASTRNRRTDAAGRFDFPFSYTARRRPVRFTAHVVATAEPTWAFTEGKSDTVKFVVKP